MTSPPPKRRILIRDVQRAVAARYGRPVQEMWSRQSNRTACRPRQVAMYLARDLTGQSVKSIARRFDRHHTTVLDALRRVEKRRTEDATLAAIMNRLRRELEA